VGDWHTKSATEVLAQLRSTPDGLSGRQAEQRLKQYGRNEIAKPKGEGVVLRLLRQLKDPMIVVLLAAAGVSLLASGGRDWPDAVIILLIVAVNGVISVCQEDNARRALAALEQMAPPQTVAVRDGRACRMDAALLVPGDVVLLQAGDRIPADGRLLECVGLRTDESALTGESVPVEKTLSRRLEQATPVGEWSNMVLASTTVTAGRGRAVIVDTGMDTQMGKIAGLLLVDQQQTTPLQRKMEEISKVLSLLCLGVCAVMFGVGLLQGKAPADMFLTAVSLAVAAIPEGLPAVVSIVLALGVGRMAKTGVIVKKLPAVETLGCAGVICSDKTGTLTQNRMTVTRVWTAGEDNTLALTIGALCSDARLQAEPPKTVRGDPTEAALVLAAAEAGLLQGELERQLPRVGEVPFDSGRKRMTTVHKKPAGGWRILVKGAPDVLLARCDRVWKGGPIMLDDTLRKAIAAANEGMAQGALRVLAVAFRDVDSLPPMTAQALERELTFVGLFGMTDPPRPEVAKAVAQCVRAGVRPVMITGDHRATAVAVARQLGMLRPGDTALTGRELDAMSQRQLEERIETVSVFARVTPEHKMRIVRAWKKRGQVVAMTGDGVNDAPALKAADIGCAMGMAGTDVAKGAADMVLTDDNFASIVRAVEEGRGVYANIRRAIHYLLSCNVGEILTVFAATVLGFAQMPLMPVQLLWLNLVTDSLPALALGVEPLERSAMTRPPRGAGDSLFDRPFVLRLLWQGLMVGGLALLAYFLGLAVMPTPAGGAATANTMAFATLTLCQLFHAYNVRSEERSILSIGVLTNPTMNRAFAVGFAMQMAVLLLPPLQRVFSVVSLGPVQWLAVLLLAMAPVAVCEAAKALTR